MERRHSRQEPTYPWKRRDAAAALTRTVYQADFTTNNQGNGEVRARGIFSEELFVFAAGSVDAPQVDDQDAEKNPAFDPVHTFHLGLWFGDPEDAKDAGCSDTVTAFDGDHEAGIQAFSTRNFPKLEGPLGEIQ
jgi:hypothetical protein